MEIYQKLIPQTDKKNYLSGWQSLNLSFDDENNCADWHFTNAFYSTKPTDILETFTYNNKIGYKGILKRKIKIFSNEQWHYIASYPRAVFDLWHKFIKTNQFDMLNDFNFSKKQVNVLKSYLEQCSCSKCKEYLSLWI
ncbi:hypothetical protein [Mycoplasmopsis felifaucium]|uniref:hypothetical protein n=1 Tax=Mycoplasmopsis felifaucium TaxID=35768 RepID=UPI0004842E52|nr:hypothetical protein [Mycoplasmopsis felifaucium]